MNLQPLTGGPDPPLANQVPFRPDTDTLPEASEPLPPDSAPSTSTPQPAPSTSPERRSHSKIGRLSKTIRDKLNFMIRDGVPYGDILSKLGDDAKDITARNISSWQSSPHYQRWLLEQDWLEKLRADQECAFDLLDNFDAARFNQASLQLAVTRVFLALRHIESGDLNQKLGGNARTFAGLVHSLARACRETTHIEKYRDACARVIAAELKQLNIDRELSDNEYQLLVNKADQVFKVRRRPHLEVVPSRSTDPPAAASNQDGPGQPDNPSASPPSTTSPSPPLEERASERRPFDVPTLDSMALPPLPDSIPAQPPSNFQPPDQEHCPHCKAPVPPRQANGIRPELSCQHCFNPLPFVVLPPAQPPEFCPQCDMLLPSLLPDGQRPSPACRCGSLLPAPGMAVEQKTDHCTECGARLPALLPNGDRPSPNCPACGSGLPPPRPAATWLSEYCLFCGTHLDPSLRTSRRIREHCVICGGPLPPVGGHPPPNPATDSS